MSIVAILVLNPSILILDEPTSGQDLRHYTEIMEFLKELNERGITIIMITHDMHLMLEYTNRAIVVTDGEIIADDLTWNVLTHEVVIEQAHLKQTSLYQLANHAQLPDPIEFIQKFITIDKVGRHEY